MTKKELRQKLLKYYQKNIDKKINNRIMPYKFLDLYALGLTENYYVCYNTEERRLESFDSLECINHVEEFKTLLNLIKRGEKRE